MLKAFALCYIQESKHESIDLERPIVKASLIKIRFTVWSHFDGLHSYLFTISNEEKDI